MTLVLCCAVRLQKQLPEYEGRVRVVDKAFPLEVYGGGLPDRHELELEIWLAALQEPAATFKPFSDDFPTTTLPAFDAAWCAFQQGDPSDETLTCASAAHSSPKDATSASAK
ncbi:MAG: hypothetical protein U0X92_06510 [Anaerolineales bacterium]